MEQRLIDAAALRKAVNDFYDNSFEGIVSSDLIKYAEAVDELIDNAPTVDTTFREVVAYECGQKSVEERPKGKWRSVGFEKGYAFCICSNCGNTTRLYRDSKNEFCCIADIRNKVIACLYCGADMRSVVDEGLHERAISDLSKAVDDAYKKARGDV